MTTKVTIEANHNWPVRVTGLEPVMSTELPNHSAIVKAGESRSFSVHSTLDLRIHEIQPTEPEFAHHKAPSDDASAAETGTASKA